MSRAPLTGRRALVTGGSRGIGAQIVRRLAADGAAVAFTYAASAVESDKLVGELTADGAKVVAWAIGHWGRDRRRREDTVEGSWRRG